MSASAIAGAAVSAGGVVANLVSGNAMNRRAQKEAQKTRAWQTAEREAQNEWNLNQWNRENEYNSISSQMFRAKLAGLSPLSVLNGADAGSAAHLESAQDPSGQIAQVFNPMANADFGSVAQSFLQFKDLELRSKKTDADIDNENADTLYKLSLKATEDALRKGRVEFLGVDIKFKEAATDTEKMKVQEMAQGIEESKRRIEQMFQFMRESDCRIDVMQWTKYCESKKIDKEVALLGARILQAQAETKTINESREWMVKGLKADYYGKATQNKMANNYYDSGYFMDDVKNRNQVGFSQAKQAAGHTKHDFLYSVDNAMESVSNVIAPLTEILQGFMFYEVGRSNRAKRKSMMHEMDESTPNPESSFDSTPQYNQFFQ